MSLHEADLKSKLNRFLARKSAPRLLDNKPEAQADEIGALLASLKRVAPRDPGRLTAWWETFQPILSEACGRMWPTEKEIAQAGRSASERLKEDQPSQPTDAFRIDPAELAARFMSQGEPVGENWLYGVSACELIKRGLVDEVTMRKYRSAAYFNWKFYGEERARQWESEAIKRHEHVRGI